MAEMLKKGGESSAQLHKRKKSERSELSRYIHPRRDSLSPQYTCKSDLRKKRKKKKLSKGHQNVNRKIADDLLTKAFSSPNFVSMNL